MANQSKLKAWVRYDGTGRVISGGPIFQVNKPKVGNWKQINANLCCNGNTPTTTTTTTNGGGGGTPTAWVAYTSFNPSWSCQQINGTTRVLYTSVTTLTTGAVLYTDATLTEPYNYLLSNYVAIGNQVWEITSSSGAIENPQPCSSSTTIYRVGNTSYNSFSEACFNAGDIGNGVTLYSNGSGYDVGTQLYYDPEFNSPYSFSGWRPSMINFPFGNSTGIFLSNGIIQAGLPC